MLFTGTVSRNGDHGKISVHCRKENVNIINLKHTYLFIVFQYEIQLKNLRGLKKHDNLVIHTARLLQLLQKVGKKSSFEGLFKSSKGLLIRSLLEAS
jgi:hypothetical protein